jgi:RHS repeat-associated protein
VYYYHPDHLGSTQLVTDWDGRIYEHLEYAPYGELWVDHAVAAVGMNPTVYRFSGKEMDEETGFYYYGARYLDPRTSRWISADPAMGDGSYIPSAPINDEAKKRNGNLPGMGGVFNYVNLHVYHYAGNNPVKYVDPDGEADVYFLYVYKTNVRNDQRNRRDERNSINKVVRYLKKNGLSVEIIKTASKSDVTNAFSDPEALMIVTSGHGNDKAEIETADNKTFSPADINVVGDLLQTVIFENCFQGDYTDDWEKAIGKGKEIVGWSGITTVRETKRFNRNKSDTRQEKGLMDYAKQIVEKKRNTISIESEDK